MRKILTGAVLAAALSSALSQNAVPADSDRDGLNDTVEAALLAQFLPQFMVSPGDCSVRPAAFVSNESKPIVESENGTVYGQVFPRMGQPDQVELHYYHLWRRDCGDLGHSLDAEHVSVLVSRDRFTNWKALYWYAAAHEDTICDASQLARASTLGAELNGPKIWISRGKHASFLSEGLCARGCGSDECRNHQPLPVPAVINLGEPSAPAVGSWVEAAEWPLAGKMRRSDFADERLASIERLSATTIIWANPQKRPYQAAIRGGNGTIDGTAAGVRAVDVALTATDVALDLADTKTGNALSGSSVSTGNGLAKSYRGVKKALSTTAQKVSHALGRRDR